MISREFVLDALALGDSHVAQHETCNGRVVQQSRVYGDFRRGDPWSAVHTVLAEGSDHLSVKRVARLALRFAPGVGGWTGARSATEASERDEWAAGQVEDWPRDWTPHSMSVDGAAEHAWARDFAGVVVRVCGLQDVALALVTSSDWTWPATLVTSPL